MRYVLHILHSLLRLSSTTPSATARPTAIQLDLIFPRNKTTYAPTYPFPIVFALHNGSAAPINWHWQLGTADAEASPIASGEYNTASKANGGRPPPDKHLLIHAVSNLGDISNQELVLRYGFGIAGTCNSSETTNPVESRRAVYFTDTILFTVDRETGAVPNVTAAGPCSLPLGAMALGKEMETDSAAAACPVVQPCLQCTQKCALVVDEAVAERVAKAMLRAAPCAHPSWPGGDSLVGKCDTKLGRKGWWRDVLMTTLMAVVMGSVAWMLVS
ncbi:hypothetical protein BDW02DRAFT_571824 [Decorospora gaudefroyi]|uniref:DUF7136 domain-containing protein n=1 Tax=Decorospora gaudefroyi TaxID=184978 RepID=A0A6A5KB07_9PLEO|nr:hypothetical protein BDW02DRAFT_571824 [Decorospora gaudefroyi]